MNGLEEKVSVLLPKSRVRVLTEWSMSFGLGKKVLLTALVSHADLQFSWDCHLVF